MKKRFEYVSRYFRGNIMDLDGYLNELGRDQWELISSLNIVEDKINFYLIFKREINI